MRRFIRAHSPNLPPSESVDGESIDAESVEVESFDALAIDIAKHQVACRTGLDRLFERRGLDVRVIETASQIPAVPTDVFKLRRVACHPRDLDKVVFLTSGTTVGSRGMHALRDTETYRLAARVWASTMLYPDMDIHPQVPQLAMHWVVLAPPYDENPSSSLGFMFDELSRATRGGVTWAVTDGKLDLAKIERALHHANSHSIPTIVAGASFAFVHWLDAIQHQTYSLGPMGRAMQTGGFKGQSRTVDADQLRADIALVLGINVDRVVSEYGMTELGSQAYEGRLRASLGHNAPNNTHRNAFVPPPWMRVVAVKEDTLEPVHEGQVGIARIEDLTNVDSAVVVQTADRIRQCEHCEQCEGGFELLGRAEGASPRGCSIGIDEILQQNGFRNRTAAD